jgi:hypothetical protein
LEKTDIERWPFYLGTEDIKYMLLNCSHPNKWRVVSFKIKKKRVEYERGDELYENAEAC